MSTPLPPNPYEALGVTKDAKLPEIRSAHRKLVLKCHPDKVQDAALKAVKQDEFQKVQQAYELLSDENRRIQYDEQVKLFELRKEMGRGNPTARSNPFEYEVRTAEPRASTFKTTRPAQPVPKTQPMPKVYTHEAPKSSSYEEFARYEDLRGSAPRKTASYESTDRKRVSARDEDRRRQQLEEDRIRYEKEAKRSSHKDKKKASDKEKRRGTEEKHSRTTYVDADDSDDYSHPTRRTSDKKSSRHRVVEAEVRYAAPPPVAREEQSPTIPLDPKWSDHKDFAAQYMQASRQKAVPIPKVEEFRPHPPRRAETFAAPSNPIQVRHVAPPQYSDDESPRRSSARKESRRSSETPARTRERSTKDRSRRSSPTHTPVYTSSRGEPMIVSPPSPPILPSRKQPAMPTHSSSPANLASYIPREKPSRSKTDAYPRKDPVPSISRSNTYHLGDQHRDRTGTGSSRLKQAHPVDTDSSDSDAQQPTYAQRRSLSPAPRQSHRPETTTRYVVDQGRSVPIVARHRSEMRGIDDEHAYSHDRSPSPRGARRSRERPPPTTRTHSTSRGLPVRSVPTTPYYAPEPEPIIRDARPKMPPREGGHQTSRGNGPYFGEVKYSPNYTPESVIYTAAPKDLYSGRRNEPSSHSREHYYPTQRSSGSREVYA